MRVSTMMTTRSRPFPTRPRALMIAAAALLAMLAPTATEAMAQDGGGAPLRNRRPVRPPVIDLERAAREIREGQIVPGSGAEAASPAPGAEEAGTDADAILAPAPAPTGAASAAENAGTPSPAAMAMMRSPAPLAAAGIAAMGEPVAMRVRAVGGPPSQVEWRVLTAAEDGAWAPLTADETVSGRVEVRTGFGGWVLLEVDGKTSLRVGRMSRVRLERLPAAAVGRGAREELLVRLDRGQVEVEPRALDELGLAEVPVRVLTPSASLVRRVALEVTHDAFHGTRETALLRE